jgi:hypothetical protein
MNSEQRATVEREVLGLLWVWKKRRRTARAGSSPWSLLDARGAVIATVQPRRTPCLPKAYRVGRLPKHRCGELRGQHGPS